MQEPTREKLTARPILQFTQKSATVDVTPITPPLDIRREKFHIDTSKAKTPPTYYCEQRAQANNRCFLVRTISEKGGS